MSDAHQALSYTISADDRAIAVFRGLNNELRTTQSLARAPLAGLNKEWNALLGRRPLELVRADQVLQLARTESELRKLNKAVAESGVATKLQAAELDVLTKRHTAAQAAVAKTTSSHHALKKAGDVAAAGVLGATAIVVAGAVKQGIAWEELGKQITQQTGISGKALDSLMATIANLRGKVPYEIGDVSQAAVMLRQRFGETGPQIEKTDAKLVAFAHRAATEVGPAAQGLSNILRDFREPLTDVTGLMDELVGVSQLTQQPLSGLESIIERFGPKLQALGFNLHDTNKLLGIMGESGLKADNFGRGLATAFTQAQKELGGTAGLAATREKLDKAERRALESKQLVEAKVPKTIADQQKQTVELRHANEAYDEARKKQEALAKVVAQAGGAHATAATLVRVWIGEIEHAKSQQDAYALAGEHFGKQVGPLFARAFYNNKAAIEAADSELKKHGQTQQLVTEEQHSFKGELVQTKEEWHEIEKELGEGIIPVLKDFLGIVGGGVKVLGEFVREHKLLAEILGGGAVIGATGYLARGPLGTVARGLSHVPGLGGLSKIPGVSGGAGEISGVTGFVRPGSITNPIMVRVEGGGGTGPGGVGTAAKVEGAGGEGLLAKLKGGAKLAGGAALAIEALNVVLPGNATSHGLPTHGSGLGGQFKGWISDSSEALTKGFGDVLNLDPGKALSDLFGHNAKDDLRSFGDELKKLKQPLTDLPVKELEHLHKEAESLGRNKDLAQWAPQLEKIAEATDPLKVASERAGLAFVGMRSKIEGTIVQLEAKLRAHPSSQTRQAVISNYNALITGIGNEMAAGLVSVQEGNAAIDKSLLAEAKVLGISPAQLSATLGKTTSAASGVLGAAAGGLSAGFATGGRVPGPVSGDTWTILDPAGRPAGMVGGQELLIPNRHTEDRVNRMLAPYGTSLGAEVAGETRPHSAPRKFATGGQLSHYDRLIMAMNRVSAANFPYRWGGGHEQPSRFEPFDCSGAVSYAVQQAGYRVPTSTSGGMGALGFPGGAGEVTIFYNPVHTFMRAGSRYWGTSGFARPGGGAGWFDQPPSAGYLGGFSTVHLPNLGADTVAPGGAGVTPIKAPAWKGPAGLVGDIGRAAVAKAAVAATRRLERAAAAIGALPGGGGSIGQELKDGTLVTASEFGGHNDPSAFNKKTASGAIANDSLWGFAELSHPGTLDFSALGHLAMGTKIKVGYNGKSITVPKVDVGAGGPAIPPAKSRAIDLTFAASHALGAPGLENVRYAKAQEGGRLSYAGAFGSGGAVTASSPTMAVFGERGPETAVFIPHAALGTRVGRSGLAETEGVNPDTGAIEYHTSEAWKQIRTQHSAHVKHEQIELKAARKALVPVKEAEKAARDVLAVLKASGEGDTLGATAKALGELKKLVADARRLHNEKLSAILRKDIETALKYAASTLMRQASEAPAGQQAQMSSTAVSGLSRLLTKAENEGRRGIELVLLRDIQKTIATWHSAIQGQLAKRQTAVKAGAELRVAQQQLKELQAGGGGVKVKAGTATDDQFIKETTAADAAALKQYEAEQRRIQGLLRHEKSLLKRLKDKLHKELRRHHGAVAKALRSEIAAVQSALGEAQEEVEGAAAAIAETETAKLDTAAEALKGAYEKFKEEVDASTRAFEASRESLSTAGTLEEGRLHREGKDFAGLEEDKSKQEGVLTPAQVKQAEADLAAFRQRKQQEMEVLKSQRAYDESVLPGLSGEDAAAMRKAIEALTVQLSEAESAIHDQEKATKKLTEATNTATKTFGGTVGFEYQGQGYSIGGQSSVSAPNIMTGV